jgi:hypothetical protein
MVFTGWKHFDEQKYNSCFSYISEIAKRGLASGFNKTIGKNYSGTPRMISIENFKQ